jgi:spermidine synthase
MREIVEQIGPLQLARTEGVWEILWDGVFLMSSQCRASEKALGALAWGRTLVGGLGMGFTLRAALDQPGVTAVDVAEIAPAVVAWNRGPLAPLAQHPLDDPRVLVLEQDLAQVLAGARDRWDRILLDVDNGPSWTARPENDALYGDEGLRRVRAALRPGGLLAVWSAQPEPAFAARLAATFPRSEAREIPVEVGGRPTSDHLYLGVCS